ncbi:c-type cytochrome [Marinomonas sp. 2405UD68-3]|uniref:c-type cytochrome n=1 Tax=Marinomonas sp. 2405UD68-3 TaxID=3391835 RepID=UPI0039C8E117
MSTWINIVTASFITGATAFWILTDPNAPITNEQVSQLTTNVDQGKNIFNIGGCVSCHVSKLSEEQGDMIRLAGGKRFKTEFGTFIAPNITPDKETGIGNWTTAQFANAMIHGVSPSNEHYYPAFPYTSYARMALQDVVNLKAYMDTLPAIVQQNAEHDLSFPFTIRRGLGLWKQLHLDDSAVVTLNTADPTVLRGQYLVEGPGHCGECHSPRNQIGGLDYSNWLMGASSPDGKGRIPSISPHDSGISEWSQEDIAEYLASGFTPEYDSAGGDMTEVIENTSKLPESDRDAIAAYLKALP